MRAKEEVGGTSFSMPSDQELTVTRVVDAPVGDVFSAHTNAQHIPQWMLGPEEWSMPICEIDLREGKGWHFGWRRADGESMDMRGQYKEIVPPHRLVWTESWGGDWPEMLNTMELSEQDGRTTITTTVRYPSKQTRDAAMETGMKEGMAHSYDRLDEYLRTMV